MQVDPVLGLEDDVVQEEQRCGRGCSHFETEQNQGDGHLQLEHGKLLPDAVPADVGGEGDVEKKDSLTL